MKKLFTVLAAVLFTACAFAQAPQMMSYQAVIRNANNVLDTNHSVGIRVSILRGSATGTLSYQEIYNPNPQTNANGLVSLEIGNGVPITGLFDTINWANGTYFIKTETDPTGGTNYTITGTSHLLSVPFALYAQTTVSHGKAMFNYTGTTVYWQAPPGVTTVWITASAGGGGGGNGVLTVSPGGGGGGANAVIAEQRTVTPGAYYAVYVGGGGLAGSNGDNSTFGGASFFITVGGFGGGGNATDGAAGGLGGAPGLNGNGGGSIFGIGGVYNNSGVGLGGSGYGGGGSGGNGNGNGSGSSGAPGFILVEW